VNNVQWEFEPIHAVRSIVPPSFMTLLPLRVYAALLRPWIGSRFTTSSYPLLFQEADFTEIKPHGGKNGIEVQKSFLKSSMLWEPAMEYLSGKEILLVPRLFMALLSVIFLDGSLWMLLWYSPSKWAIREDSNGERGETSTALTFSSMTRSGPPMEVIVLASSWPCLVFGMRPFTNNLEAMVLAFLLVIVVRDARVTTNVEKINHHLMGKANRGVLSLLLIGATCSVGIFVRFTFAFFAFPVMIIFLWNRWKEVDFKLIYVVHDGLWMAFSFLLVSCAFIWVDTLYYSWQTKLTCNDTTTTCEERFGKKMGRMLKFIVPFNAFRYNSKSSNLAEHGLHPRITHAAVNMPMLFGPLALVGFGSMAKNMRATIIGRREKNRVGSIYSFTKNTCQWTIFSGLLVLSCAPHQEPRFILPSIVPLVFLYGRKVVGGGKVENSTHSALSWHKHVWITFNFILYMFFGWLHQGGLLPSLFQLLDLQSVIPRDETVTQSPRAFIYYKTYMPPTFLTLGTRKDGVCDAPGMESGGVTCSGDFQHEIEVILDLQGENSSVLLEVLHKWLPCHSPDISGNSDAAKHSDSADDRFLHLVSPPSVVLPLMEECDEPTATMKWEEYSIILTQDHHGHISTEDWPTFDGSVKNFLGQLKLDLYTVSCVQDLPSTGRKI